MSLRELALSFGATARLGHSEEIAMVEPEPAVPGHRRERPSASLVGGEPSRFTQRQSAAHNHGTSGWANGCAPPVKTSTLKFGEEG